ncbi:MAG TPA: LUD domain-containing protein [Flavipsychrobacter sp.]|nr:LUD domain-containing protein [Flavipsychrobacter sp.]
MQTFKTSKSKESILNKIRTALNEQAVPTPFPEVDKEQIKSVYDKDDLTIEEKFANEFIKLGGKFVFCDNEQELIDNIQTLYESRAWKQLLCSDKRLINLLHNNKIDILQLTDPKEENADACITGCEALISRTGSVLFSSHQYMGRTAPVFYPIHIIVAYANQIVYDVEDGIRLLKQRYNNELPSMINLNTGPSRTADIEKTLVVGVHGPAEVFCLYVNAW